MSSDSARLRRSWIANAPAWCKVVREGLIESRRQVTDAAIVAAVLDQKPRRVLDLGCGEGWLARALSTRGIEVTGVDATEALVEAARALGGGTFAALSYEDIIASPASAGSDYDVIVANFSLLDDKADEVLRALRARVAIVQTVHPLFVAGDSYEDGWRTETFSAMPGEWPEEMPWYFRTIGSWFRLFATAGYDVADVREPSYPDRPVPASMIFIGRARK